MDTRKTSVFFVCTISRRRFIHSLFSNYIVGFLRHETHPPTHPPAHSFYRGRAEYKGRPLYLACQIGKNGPKSPLPRGGFFRRWVRTRGRNARFSAFAKSVRQVVGSFRKNGLIFRCLNFPPFLALTHSFTRFHSVCTHFQAMFGKASSYGHQTVVRVLVSGPARSASANYV